MRYSRVGGKRDESGDGDAVTKCYLERLYFFWDGVGSGCGIWWGARGAVDGGSHRVVEHGWHIWLLDEEWEKRSAFEF